MNETEKAKLYYLFMISDGTISSKELSLYQEICTKMDLPSDFSQKIAYTYDHLTNSNNTNTDEIIKEIKEIIPDNNFGSYLWFSYDSFKNKKTQTKLLWNLINLGFSDTYFSDSEKQIIDFLANYWEFNQDILNEMIDVAETMYALEDKKEWIKQTKWTYDQKEASIKKVDKALERLNENVKIIISESDIMLNVKKADLTEEVH